MDNSDIFFGAKIPALLDSQGDVQTSPTNYTFVGADVPTLLWRYCFFFFPRLSYEIESVDVCCWMKVDVWNAFVPS